jgi:dTDP-4-dehydrorhamnose 3,5-epimerase
MPIQGVVAIKRLEMADERGSFSRLYCADELEMAGWNTQIVQVNHSFTKTRGTVRGLHYQKPPQLDQKIITCLSGAVWDVAVDLRKNSPTFLQWCSVELSATNHTALLLPKGCAHGFQAITNDVTLVYMHSAGYDRELDGCINPNDTRIGIEWPLEISLISERDKRSPMTNGEFRGLDV